MSRRLPIVTFKNDQEKQIYSKYFNIVMPPGPAHLLKLPSSPEVQAFFRLSKLSKPVLEKIWDYVDQGATSNFDQNTFNVGLRLIAIAQQNKEPNLLGLNTTDVPPPRFSGHESVLLLAGIDVRKVNWKITSQEVELCKPMFLRLVSTVKDFLPFGSGMAYFSQLGVNVSFMRHIWFLSDYDQDMNLDFDEFCVAMHLINGMIQGTYPTLPNCLPVELIHPSKRGGLDPSVTPSRKPSIMISSPPNPLISDFDWTISESTHLEAAKFWKVLTGSNQTISKTCLSQLSVQFQVAEAFADIAWNLVDVDSSNSLNTEQFVYLVHIINKIHDGNNPPARLPVNISSKLIQSKSNYASRTPDSSSSSIFPPNSKSMPNLMNSALPSQPMKSSKNLVPTPSAVSAISSKSSLDSHTSLFEDAKSHMGSSDFYNNTSNNGPNSRFVSLENLAVALAEPHPHLNRPRVSHGGNLGISHWIDETAKRKEELRLKLEKLRRKNVILDNCIREARLYKEKINT